MQGSFHPEFQEGNRPQASFTFGFTLNLPTIPLNTEFQSPEVVGGTGRRGRECQHLPALTLHLLSTFLWHLEGLSFISPLSLKGISPTKHSPYSCTWNHDRRKDQDRKTNLLTKDTSPGIPERSLLLNM